jgi:anti-sigma regulatory factor (Ser/Thr protein kinase)
MSVVEQDDLSDRPSGSLAMSYPAVAESVPAARAALASFAEAAGIEGVRLDSVKMACSEALSNAVLHAYRGRHGTVHVTAGVAGDDLWILIADDGVGLHARGTHSGLGLGLTIIARVTDGLEVAQRGSGGTELRLRFALPSREQMARQPRGSISSARSPARLRFSTIR